MTTSGLDPAIDEYACRLVMDRYGLASPTAALNLALRTLAIAPLSPAEVRRMRVSDMAVAVDALPQPAP
jgi:hypothetical protein